MSCGAVVLVSLAVVLCELLYLVSVRLCELLVGAVLVGVVLVGVDSSKGGG